MSGKLAAIGINSDKALDKFAALEKQSREAGETMKVFGGSVGALRQKLELLKNERDWIPQAEIATIKKYNGEITKLEKSINKLETIDGSKLKKWGKDAIASMPGAEFITNSIVAAGAAMVSTAKASFSFDEGMAKINATAMLSQPELNKLGTNLQNIGTKYGADMGRVPEAFEKIISQMGEINPSMEVFESALKGAKATGADIDVVSGALAQTKSILGDASITADDVLNTFLAAKRVGAGEFKDFAAYMPNLISGANSLGINYKQTAGMFAYMTGKGFDAARSATLMENAFSAMGKNDVRKNLGKAGVKIFDHKGSMRDLGAIFGDLNKRMAGMSDEGKSKFLEKMGLVDKEARSAFIVMAGDANKLNESLRAVGDGAKNDEIGKALKAAQHPLQKIQELWSKVQVLMIKVGSIVGGLLVPAFAIASIVIDGVNFVLDKIVGFFTGWVAAIQSGNPWIVGLTALLALLTLGMAIQWAWVNRLIIQQKLKAAWDFLVAASTGGWAAAQAVLNALLINNPVGWVIILIISLIAAIGYVIMKTDGWGNMWDHTVKGANLLWQAFVADAKWHFQAMIAGIEIGMLTLEKGWYHLMNLMGKAGASEKLNEIGAEIKAKADKVASGRAAVNDLYDKSGKEFAAAGNSLSWNSERDVIGDIKNKLGIGIADPDMPGAPTGNTPKPPGGDNTTKTNEDIATGGTKNTTVHITIGNQIGQLSIAAGNMKEGAKKIGDVIVDELTRAVAMGAALGGSQ